MYRFNLYDSQQGIALLIVLVFMQVFALLGLYSITECILLQKMSESEFSNFSNSSAPFALRRLRTDKGK